MRRIALFLAVGSLHAASYYVSSTGNDSSGTGSAGAPWLTLAHAVAGVASGDTINIVANGAPVTCDVTLPANITDITVQSSRLAFLNSVGYRVSPSDAANLGKCQFSSSGITAQGEVHGFNGGAAYQQFSRNGSTFTLTSSNSFAANGMTLSNGSQLDFEINNQLNGDVPPPPTVAVPSPLTILTHYYVVNCSTSPACGAQNSTFQVSATFGGSPITITACDSNCLAYGQVGLPLQASVSSNTITSPDGLSSIYANGTPITFASGGLQLGGMLPSPLQQDVIYYVINLSGNTFKVAATPAGSAITLTSAGTGMISMSNANVPHGWKFSGIEAAPTNGTFLFNVFQVGSGLETSQYSMVHHFEFDRIYCHDFSNAQNGPRRCIADNSQYLYVHDSYISGMKDQNNDSQAISGWGSLGPTAIINNFLEAAGENILYGGGYPTYYPLANQNKVFIGNHFYKPFIWKYGAGTGIGAPTGTCLYDQGIDPNHQGGEFFLDTAINQGYVCVAGTWTTTASRPNHYGVKNIFEFKSGRNFTLLGNVFQGSWTDQQNGQALLFAQSEGSGPGFANDHITALNNKIVNTFLAITWGSHCTGLGTGVLPCVGVLPGNHSLINNLAVLGGIGYCGLSLPVTCGSGMWGSLWSGHSASQDTFNHNTIVAPDGVSGSPYFPASYLYDTIAWGTAHDRMTYTNNIQSYDFSGAIGAFASTFTNSHWDRMVLIGATGSYTGNAGPGNTMTNTIKPANTAAVGFVNAGAGDYHLASSSPFSAQNGTPTLLSSDGTDLGADIDAINMAISGAAAGTPPWDQQAELQLTLGSTQAVFHYKAPTSSACTATLYNAPARIPANQAASVTDSSANSISDGLTRQLYISGLAASRQYWYKLVCGGGVILVGETFTRAVGSGTYQFSFDFNAATDMRYSTSSSMSNPTVLGAATRQSIPVASNSVIYAQVGTTGPITILIAP